MRYAYFFTYLINISILVLIFFNILKIEEYELFSNFETHLNKKILIISFLFFIYILLVIFNIPLTPFLTAYSGAILGVYETIVYVFFASSIGSYLSLIVNRYFINKQFIKEKLAKLKVTFKVNIFYIILLKAFPIFPFSWVIIYVSTTNYSSKKFLLANFVGCLSTITIVANFGKAIFENNLYLVLIFSILFILIFVFGMILKNYFLKK